MPNPSHDRALPGRAVAWARATIGCALLCVALAAHPQASVPWTPSASARHALELLVDEAGLGLTTTQWPLPRRTVAHALGQLPATLAPALAEARELVRRELARSDASALSLTLRGTAEVLSGYGDDATRGSSVALHSSTFDSEWLTAQLGARIDASGSAQGGRKLRLDDSAVATEALGVQLQVWAHRSWWGPGWQSSLILGNNAPAFSGIGLQRASAERSDSRWLAWLGPWNFEVFLAQTEDVSEPANPYFIGQRLTFRPFSNLEIGMTRSAQWSGRGRPGSWKSFFRMLGGTGVNADTPDQQAVDPANEMAGYDLRLRCPFAIRCAAYVQGIGEDQAGLWPSRFLGLYGIEGWSADGRQRYFAEYAETGCRTPIRRPALTPCAYRNYAYPQGYTNAGRWIGAGVGPDSRLLTLGWLDTASASSLRLHVGHVGSRIGSFSPDTADASTSGRLVAVSAQRRFEWGAASITPELAWQHIAAPDGGHTDARIGATLQMNLDDRFAAAGDGLGRALSSSGSADWRPLWVSAGLVLAAALLDRPVDAYVKDHGDNPSARSLGHLGSALPVAGVGLAGLSWALQRGSVQGDVAQAALLASVSALAASEVGKFAVDRARPHDELGPTQFGGGARRQSSFPSRHSAVAWAVATPYAKHYDAPWLYGLAALSGAGRLADRQHWASDVVAGAVLGYWVGDTFYRRSVAAGDPSGARVWITPRAVTLHVPFDL
jgi:hypothetical protein